ncbi:hypothetical protein ADL02_08545 [Streptomyces sp. NRRL WC-3723]|nr:hypothetical protein ADL02_08545 [Streptomyces sp. NRRL WC-3723]
MTPILWHDCDLPLLCLPGSASAGEFASEVEVLAVGLFERVPQGLYFWGRLKERFVPAGLFGSRFRCRASSEWIHW